MYHKPGSDKHTGRHASAKRTKTQPPPKMRVKDHTGRLIPPPPINSFGPTPLETKLAVAAKFSVSLICWSTLSTIDPLRVEGRQEKVEATYKKAADILASSIEKGVAFPVRKIHVETALRAAGHTARPMSFRTVRAARIINEQMFLQRKT